MGSGNRSLTFGSLSIVLVKHVPLPNWYLPMIFLVTTVLLSMHLVAVNLAAAAPLVCVWLGWRRDDLSGRIGRNLAWIALYALLAGTFLGFALGGLYRFEEPPNYWNMLGRFPVRGYVVVLLELVFSLVCLFIYALTWERLKRHRFVHALFACLATTNLLYHFPPLMSAMSLLADRPELILEETITRPLLRPVLMSPTVISLSVHFALASLAVTGVALMVLGLRFGEQGKMITAFGGRIALVSTLLQLVVGVWVIMEVPAGVRNGIMGNDPLTALMFGVSLFGVFGVMLTLAGVSLGQCNAAAVRRTTLLMGIVILLMVGVLVRGRHLTQRGIVRDEALGARSVLPASGESRHLLKLGVAWRGKCFPKLVAAVPARDLATALVDSPKKLLPQYGSSFAGGFL